MTRSPKLRPANDLDACRRRLVLAIAAALVLVRLHTLPTGLDPRRDAVSDYGATAFHLYYRAMVVMLGVGAACLALALHRTGDVRTSGQSGCGSSPRRESDRRLHDRDGRGGA